MKWSFHLVFYESDLVEECFKFLTCIEKEDLAQQQFIELVVNFLLIKKGRTLPHTQIKSINLREF